jgi:hypothetical protein
MAVTHVQCGIQNHRINRVPLDSEAVMYSYSDLLEHVESDGTPSGTRAGAMYAGEFTSVINDENDAYNGPYYISYETNGSRVSYTANRLASSYELDTAIEEVEEYVYEVVFEWGHL